jgi:hypothetical protein
LVMRRLRDSLLGRRRERALRADWSRHGAWIWDWSFFIFSWTR